jgi:enoyl-CoA hydratase / 3-hydroxyacyl-CoA dehydrogenase
MQRRNVLIVGAGNMGTGIAQTFAQAGYDVQIHDADPAAPGRAVARMQSGIEKLVEKGKWTVAERDAVLARVRPAKSLAEGARVADLVVEAVFEDEDTKRAVFAEADRHAPEHCILATNTSSLSVTRLAAATQRPDRVAGLHFFFPAMINRLLEVVSGKDTSDATRHDMLMVARRLGKVPIETADSPGFCVNRFFVPLMNEACRLLESGHADIPTIDAATNQLLGTPMGPFALMNATGVPISLHAQRTLHREFGAFYEPAPALVAQVEEKKADWDLRGEPKEADFETVQDRMLAVAVGIAARLVEEGVASLEDTEKGATVGLAWRRGPFELANRHGTHRTLSAVSALYTRHGEAFPVAQSLRSHGAEDRPYAIRRASLRREGGVARITLERPAALNALDEEVLNHLDEAITEYEADDTLRCAILTGEGRAFAAGADIKTMSRADARAIRTYTEHGGQIMRRIETLHKPIIAAIDGYALGGGLELALACDAVLASERAELGLPEVTLGIMPGFGGTQRLARRAGTGRTRLLVLSGKRMDGREAERFGAVDAAYPVDSFHEAVESLARSIAAASPVAVAAAKRAIRDGMDSTLEDGLEIEKELALTCFGSSDQKEGFQAFLERRRPKFPGT